MALAQFADISVYQSAAIDWQAYKAWSAAGDGMARISLRSSYGTGFTDLHYKTYRAAAEAAGIQIIHYHYAYPSLNNPQAEADYQHSVVGDIGPNDVLMLDYEETTAQATAAWALAWLERQEQNYGGKLPIIYASANYIRTRLQDARLAKYPLVLAEWTYDTSKRPSCPAPWAHYAYWQWSDKASVPGIPGVIDANIHLGSMEETTVSELLNFPFVNQLTDHDINDQFDCVPSSLAAGANYLLGKPAINDAAMKDAIYGAGYVGGTAASAYADYLKARGVHIYPIDGAYPDLLKQARQHLAAGHPVVFTRDDPYAPSHPDWSHVSVWYKDTADSLTAMDPFGAHAVTMTDSEWAQHLRFQEFWIMEKIMPIPTGWADDGHTLTAPNKVPVILGFRDHILIAPSWDAGNVPQEAEYATSQVLLHNAGVGGGTRQVFRDSLLWYTQTKGVVEEPFLGLEIDAAYALIATQQAEIATLKAAQPTPAPVDTTALVASINGIADGIAPLVAAALVEAKKL